MAWCARVLARLCPNRRAIGAWLQSRVAAGERALLLYPPGLDYIAGFFGCLYAGVVAVPAYPPSPNPNRPMSRIHAIVADSQAAVALTTTAIMEPLERRIEQTPYLKALEWSTTDNAGADWAASGQHHWYKPDISSATLAFLQSTSGSTANPKGVMISHGNLLHNAALMQDTWKLGPESHLVSWLPLYHDLGLIAGMLLPCYVGMPATFASARSAARCDTRCMSGTNRVMKLWMRSRSEPCLKSAPRAVWAFTS